MESWKPQRTTERIKIMENKTKKVENATTSKERALELLNKPLYLKDTAYDAKDIAMFVKKQSNLDRDFTSTEILYILNTCKEKGLNPMKGEISFFKARNGSIQAIPKYTTQLELLWRELKGDPDFITFNVYIDRDNDTQEWKATAKADYLNPEKGKFSREITLYSGDWKNTNGMVRFMLQKQATLQFIRVYYPHIDLGYDADELQTYNSGYKENKPMDARVVDVEVKAKSVDDLAKELK